MVDDYTTTWVLPTGITLNQANANPGGQFMFPQTLTTEPPCGSVIQEDHYNADPSAVTADGILSWVDGRPEDAGLYVSHTFFETPACVVVEVPPTVTEVPVPPVTTPTLAETGPDVTGMVVIALALVVVGGLLRSVKQ